MGIGGCIILLAVGAVLLFGVDVDLSGINVDIIGVILMVVGLIGLLAFLNVYKRRRVPPPPPEGEDGSHDYRIIE